jgi:ribosome-associated heat shock protein Hsp15
VGGPLFQDAPAATDAVAGGRVRVNGERVKPAKEIRVSDTVEVRTGEIQRTVVVRHVAEERGPATVAATLYEETPESAARREQHAPERRLSRPISRSTSDQTGPPSHRGSAPIASWSPRRRLEPLVA